MSQLTVAFMKAIPLVALYLLGAVVLKYGAALPSVREHRGIGRI
jgi:hypothetical protein